MGKSPPTMNYIGSKLLLLDFLKESMTEYMSKPLCEVQSFADIFSGTGVCTMMAIRERVKRVYSNDIQYYAYILSSVWTTKDIDNSKLRRDIEELNAANANSRSGSEEISPLEGYICRTYAVERGYFSKGNGRDIDGIRQYIERKYKGGEYTYMEYKMMIKVLLYAAVAVANVSSTFGAYLKKYQKKALRRIRLDAGVLDTNVVYTEGNTHIAYNRNVMDIEWNAEVVYIDSPYNSRRYDKNYFVLEAIAKYDDAPVMGKTGLLVDTPSSNALFCSRVSVERSFSELLRTIKCKYIFISYSTESLLDKSKMHSLMESAGFKNVKVKEILHKRFKSHTNVNPDTRSEVTEYLFCGMKSETIDTVT
ncbi:MAG: hypothetical protein EBU90_21870 [Proteobacteria bacterium]|nr:hypothetical protein [Pseudomonadota bacterium]NBP16008.1 hypothetical protein [bacterium]